MLVLRLIAALLGLAVAIAVGTWLLSGQRAYLMFAVRLIKLGVVIALVFMAMLMLERVFVPVL